MISRRLIRIKVLQVLYAYSKKNEGYSSMVAEKELFHSIDKFYDLYLLLLLLITEMANMERARIEMRQNKNIKSADDHFPSTHFAENKLIKLLDTNQHLLGLKDERKLNWKVYTDLLKKIYSDFIETELYKDYINSENHSFESDKKFFSSFYSDFLSENLTFIDFLEEENIYWNDDCGFAIVMVLKTVESFKEDSFNKKLLPLFKNDDDKDFTKKIIRSAIVNREEYIKIIKEHVENWDTERIAQLDLLILQLAISELLEFSTIPVKVTLDEFIEISKYYSTERSKVFINGILDKVIKQFQIEGRLNKKGRGLIN